MSETLAKTCFMYYSFARLIRCAARHLAVALSLVCLFTVISQTTVFAQSDEKVAFDFRARGLSAQQQGNYGQALFYYTRAAALDPKNPALYNDMGLMQEYLGQKDEAEQNYRKALALDSKYLPVYFNLGLFYAKSGAYSLAAQYLQERIERGSPDDPWTLQAQDELEKVYDAAPVLKELRLKKQAEEFSQEMTDGKKRLEKMRLRDREISFQTAYENGNAAFSEKRYDDAIEALETALALNPRSEETRFLLKRVHYAKDQAELEERTINIRQKVKTEAMGQALDQMAATPTNGQPAN